MIESILQTQSHDVLTDAFWLLMRTTGIIGTAGKERAFCAGSAPVCGFPELLQEHGISDSICACPEERIIPAIFAMR